MTAESPECRLVVPFVDGGLSASAADSFRGHLASCADCRVRLVEATVLSARLSSLSEARVGSPTRESALDRVRRKTRSAQFVGSSFAVGFGLIALSLDVSGGIIALGVWLTGIFAGGAYIAYLERRDRRLDRRSTTSTRN